MRMINRYEERISATLEFLEKRGTVVHVDTEFDVGRTYERFRRAFDVPEVVLMMGGLATVD